MNALKSTIGMTAAAVVLLGMSQFALADTISPTSYTNDTLAVGESVTIEKTVIIEATGPTGALIDVHFLIDTSGSMGSAIAGAKAAAGNILSGLAGFGDLATGVGVFAEGAYLPGEYAVPGTVINSDLSTSDAITAAAIDAVTLSVPDYGGDFPERGQDALVKAVENLSWRPGSTRFVVALGDASWKDDITSDADAIAVLDEYNVDLIGLNFGGSAFSGSLDDLGGTVYPTSTGAAAITAAILGAVDDSFASYDEVTVGDLGMGLPEIGVSVECTSADSGACVGADAIGDYDRSIDRTFTFDVTFTRVTEGDTTCDTYALVDGGIAATEVDTFTSAPVPEPSTMI